MSGAVVLVGLPRVAADAGIDDDLRRGGRRAGGVAWASRWVGTAGMPTGGVRTEEPALLCRPRRADPLLELPTLVPIPSVVGGP